LKTCPHCDVTSRKHQTEKRFFSISTRRLAESVESLNSSLALAAGNFWSKKSRPIADVKGLKPMKYQTLPLQVPNAGVLEQATAFPF